jgi:hypothetical protein
VFLKVLEVLRQGISSFHDRRLASPFHRFYQAGDISCRKRLSRVHRCQALPLLPVVPGYAVSGIHSEAAVMPANELFDELVLALARALQHGQDLKAEDLFQLLSYTDDVDLN